MIRMCTGCTSWLGLLASRERSGRSLWSKALYSCHFPSRRVGTQCRHRTLRHSPSSRSVSSFCKCVPPLDPFLFHLFLLHHTLVVSSPNSTTSSSAASREETVSALPTSSNAVGVFMPRQRAFSVTISRLLPLNLMCSFFFEPVGYLTPTELTVAHTNC